MWIQRLKSRIEALNNNQQSKTSGDTNHPLHSKAIMTLDKKVKELQIKQEVYMKRKGKTVSRVRAMDAAVATDWVFVNMEDRRTLVTDFVRLHIKDDESKVKVAAAVEKIMACKNLASRVVMGGGDPPRILDIKGVVVEAGGAKLVIKTSFVDTK
jgi:hypothetical protein